MLLKKHLNNVVDIVGGADKTKLTSTDNIGVNNVNGKLKVSIGEKMLTWMLMDPDYWRYKS